MFDALSIIFWGITYLLIVVFSVKNWSKKTPAIPYLPPILNLSWELVALFRYHGWGHIVWATLDVFVFMCSTAFIKKRKNRVGYVFALVLTTFLFNYIFNLEMGMLLSSFAIDLIMAVCYWIDKKNMLPDGRTIIAVTKLLGDLSALIFYAKYSTVILVIGMCVLVLNTCYLIFCIKEYLKNTKKMEFSE